MPQRIVRYTADDELHASENGGQCRFAVSDNICCSLSPLNNNAPMNRNAYAHAHAYARPYHARPYHA